MASRAGHLHGLAVDGWVWDSLGFSWCFLRHQMVIEMIMKWWFILMIMKKHMVALSQKSMIQYLIVIQWWFNDHLKVI